MTSTIAFGDAERLRAAIEYDPETGVFKWRTSGRSRRPDRIAGCIHDTSTPGCRTHTIWWEGKIHRAHRLAWLYVHGEWPAAYVDHINGDPIDNRLSNLRLCTQRQNLANQRIKKTNTTGAKGVTFDKSRGLYAARIRSGGKRRDLGRFATIDEAAAAYARAFVAEYGEFARLK